jgi:hypothetical protein
LFFSFALFSVLFDVKLVLHLSFTFTNSDSFGINSESARILFHSASAHLSPFTLPCTFTASFHFIVFFAPSDTLDHDSLTSNSIGLNPIQRDRTDSAQFVLLPFQYNTSRRPASLSAGAADVYSTCTFSFTFLARLITTIIVLFFFFFTITITIIISVSSTLFSSFFFFFCSI